MRRYSSRANCWGLADDPLTYPILIAEVKNQGTNVLREEEGLRRHRRTEHPKASFDTSFDTGSALLRTAQDVAASQDARGAQDVKPEAVSSPVERALADLGIEWKNVMAFGVHSDRVVIIEGPVGYKRVYAFPGAGEVEE